MTEYLVSRDLSDKVDRDIFHHIVGILVSSGSDLYADATGIGIQITAKCQYLVHEYEKREVEDIGLGADTGKSVTSDNLSYLRALQLQLERTDWTNIEAVRKLSDLGSSRIPAFVYSI